MKATRLQFTHDELLNEVRQGLELGLKRHGIKEKPSDTFSNLDSLMSGLAVFSFKFPSLLKFDQARTTDQRVRINLTQLFQVKATPCDTQMWARLNKRFQAALEKCNGKKYLWQHMLHSLVTYVIPNFETLYEAIAHPPPISLTSVI